MLLRAYVARCLERYFKTGRVVMSASHCTGNAESSLFSPESMRSRDHFRRAWQAALDAEGARGSWLTPSELFQPHYGKAIREWLSRNRCTRVVEVGAGRGSVAAAVLDGREDGMGRYDHEVEAYLTLEQSPALAAAQLERLGRDPRFGVVEGSCLDASTWRAAADALVRRGAGGDRPQGAGRTAVLMLEVLDNLPHDCVMRGENGWLETMVASTSAVAGDGDGAGGLREVHRRASDAAILGCIESYERVLEDRHRSRGQGFFGRFLSGATGRVSHSRGPERAYLPTGFHLTMESIANGLFGDGIDDGGICMLFADFSEIPDVRIEGDNAPLVAGADRDFDTYLDEAVSAGGADILFPTDFELIETILRSSSATAAGGAYDDGMSIATQSSAEWLGHHLPPKSVALTTALDGYNALLSEFPNTKVLTLVPGS